jgi:hypothetical protein
MFVDAAGVNVQHIPYEGVGPMMRFEQTLDYEHVGLPPSTPTHAMLSSGATA